MKITQDRIDQISNDISEDMVKASKAELIEVARFWMMEHSKIVNRCNGITDRVLVETLKYCEEVTKTVLEAKQTQ